MRDFDEHVWQMVAELGQEERHFNGVQHHYRLLASSWLLAMFAGVGIALSEQNLLVPPELMVCVVGLAGAIGITQLWNLDISVYHQLLDSCFVEGLKLEQKHPWLPQIRSSMLSTQATVGAPAELQQQSSPKGVLARVIWFYVVGNTTALVICLAGMLAFLGRLSVSSVVIGVIAVTGAIMIGTWDYGLFRYTRSPLLEEWSRSALQQTTPRARR